MPSRLQGTLSYSTLIRRNNDWRLSEFSRHWRSDRYGRFLAIQLKREQAAAILRS